MKKPWKCIALMEAVILFIIAVAAIIFCTRKQERINEDDVERITIVDEFWARFKVIEDTEDIKEICEILNSIDAKKTNGTGTEDIPQGGPALTFILERSSGPSIVYGYYAGIFLTRDGVRYRIEDGRLGVIWETKSGCMEGTYKVEFDEK